MIVGVISDTHSLLRPEAIAALAGVEHILHAGDVGHPSVLEALKRIAPVTAVRGNVDEGEWARALPLRATVDLAGHRVSIAHGNATPPDSANASVTVSGHSHQPSIEQRGDVLHVNPGSAGPRRFKLAVTLALLTLAPGQAPRAELIRLLP
ncbi:MAG: metallophosphoesterase family protein [Bryobacteraceae bacterium]|nr:metallophosphoesterase family protein [Bryobacteraceae bacterium]